MGYISDKERNKTIKQVNKGYGFRKFLMVVEMALLIGFSIVAILVFLGKIDRDQIYTKANDVITVQPLGWGLFVWAIVMVVLGLVTIILIFTIKPPKDTTKKLSRLESAARSGKKNDKNSAANYRDRTKIKPKK